MFKLIVGRLLEIDVTRGYAYLRIGRRDWCWTAE
jgi:hypothetical protein